MESTDPSESLFLDNLVDLGFQQKLHESAGTSLNVFLISSEVKDINSCICLELEKLFYDNRNKKFSNHVPYSRSTLVEYEPVQAVSKKVEIALLFERRLGACQQSTFRKPLTQFAWLIPMYCFPGDIYS